MRKQPLFYTLATTMSFLLLLSAPVLAVPVSYVGNIDYIGEAAGHTFKAVSATGITQKTLEDTTFLLNHLGNEGETVSFYFDDILVKTDTQPLPGTVVDLGTVIVPGEVIIESKSPDVDIKNITEEEEQTFSVVVTETKGATLLNYYWYKDGVLISDAEEYTFVGDNTNTGSNAGNYTISVEVYNEAGSHASVSWTLNVDRVKDIDGDGIADVDDNCPYIYDLINLEGCAGTDEDGDGVDDTVDTVIGDESHMTTNIENIDLSIGTETDVSQEFEGEEPVSFTSGAYTIVEFDFNFDEGELELKNITIKKQEANTTTGSIVIEGIDLTSQGKTKTVYVDNIDPTTNAVCIKDAEIASVSEISSGCDGADEYLITCDGTTQDGYTCTDEGTQYKVTGMSHSVIREDYKEPPAPSGPSPPAPTGGAGPVGGFGLSLGLKITDALKTIEQSVDSSARYSVDVENTGTVDASFELLIGDLPENYYSVSDPITLSSVGGEREGKLHYTLTLPLNATEQTQTFTVTVKGTAGVLTASESYAVLLTVFPYGVVPTTTTTTTTTTRPSVIIPTGAITERISGFAAMREVQIGGGIVLAFIVSIIVIRAVSKKRRTPWRTNYYKPSHQIKVLGSMKKQVKKRFQKEEWVKRL